MVVGRVDEASQLGVVQCTNHLPVHKVLISSDFPDSGFGELPKSLLCFFGVPYIIW